MVTQMSRQADANNDPLVLVGEITAPFGVRGQLKMVPLMDNPRTLAKLPQVTLRYPDGAERPDKVTSASQHGDVWLMRFEQIPDRDAAETLRDVQVYIRQSELPPLEPDAYYEHQLLGLRIVTDKGRDLGVIEKVHFYPANDVYETAVALVPGVGEIVLGVDLASGEMRVQDLPGLRKDE